MDAKTRIEIRTDEGKSLEVKVIAQFGVWAMTQAPYKEDVPISAADSAWCVTHIPTGSKVAEPAPFHDVLILWGELARSVPDYRSEGDDRKGAVSKLVNDWREWATWGSCSACWNEPGFKYEGPSQGEGDTDASDS